MACSKLKLHRTCKEISYKVLKLLTVFSVSCSLAFIICYFRLPFKWYYILPASIVLGLGITAASFYSKTIRCVLALTLIKLVGPQSRYIIMTIITGILIGGPFISIVYNLHEVNRTVNCTTGLVKSQSEEIQKAYNAAYKDVSHILMESVSIYKEIGNTVQRVIGPIKDTLESAGNALRSYDENVGKVKRDCKGTIDKAGNDCKMGINEAYQSCLQAVPSLENTIAQPVQKFGEDVGKTFQDWFAIRRRRSPKDLQYLCKVLDDVDTVCKPLLNTGLCSVFDVAQIPFFSTSEIRDIVDNFKLTVKPTKQAVNSIESDIGNITEVVTEMRNSFEEKFEIFKLVCGIVKHIPSGLLIAMPLMSYLYLRGYHKAILNDNLNKFFHKDSRKESKKIVTQLVSTMAHFLLCLFVFGFDYLLFASQQIANTYGGATFNASGYIDIDMNIKAGSVFQPIIDSFLKVLSAKQTYEVSVSTSECLPKPMPSTGLSDICVVVLLYILMILSFVLQRFTGHFKQKIVQRFYPAEVSQEHKLIKK